MTAAARVLVARCDNYREDVDTPCTGEIRFRWGMSQSDPCNVCGSRCGIAVAAWERVELAGAVTDTGRPAGPLDRDLVAEDLHAIRERLECACFGDSECPACGALRRIAEIADAAAASATPSGGTGQTREMPTGQAFLDAFYTPSLLSSDTAEAGDG